MLRLFSVLCLVVFGFILIIQYSNWQTAVGVLFLIWATMLDHKTRHAAKRDEFTDQIITFMQNQNKE